MDTFISVLQAPIVPSRLKDEDSMGRIGRLYQLLPFSIPEPPNVPTTVHDEILEWLEPASSLMEMSFPGIINAEAIEEINAAGELKFHPEPIDYLTSEIADSIIFIEPVDNEMTLVEQMLSELRRIQNDGTISEPQTIGGVCLPGEGYHQWLESREIPSISPLAFNEFDEIYEIFQDPSVNNTSDYKQFTHSIKNNHINCTSAAKRGWLSMPYRVQARRICCKKKTSSQDDVKSQKKILKKYSPKNRFIGDFGHIDKVISGPGGLTITWICQTSLKFLFLCLLVLITAALYLFRRYYLKIHPKFPSRDQVYDAVIGR
ncbi:MAG: hypothetical protein KAW12_07740 [Candidatus Aminicenantes bacterium]|nr:hypothetical protein [Candidatus Aminicenantes bacterium]